jgi:peptidoglycan/LPS O-acetylase OafA/YrhL
MAQYEITMEPSIGAKLVFVGLIVFAMVLAILLFHFVEEPARMWMRRMVGERRPPVDLDHTPQSDATDATHGTLAIHGPREDRPTKLRAQAG